MRFLLVLTTSLSLLFAACGSDEDDGQDATPADVSAVTDATAEVETDASPDDIQPELESAPTFPEPADPVPTPDPGTYTWTDGDNKIELAFNDNMIFLLEMSFGCMSDTGTKAKNDFLKITCNKAYDKGYTSTFSSGVASIEGIKGKDKLYCALTSSQTIDCAYQLLSYPAVCTEFFNMQAVWKSTGDCSDYAVVDCDPYTDANCEEGMNCVFGAGDKPVCIVAGEVPAGEECSVEGNCADGTCMELSGVEGQYCYKYCKSINDCPYGTQCLSLDGKQYKVCSLTADQFETCNLLTQNCEAATDGCYWSSSTINQPVCLPAGTAENGESCTTGSDCIKGYDCIAGKVCRKICNLTEGQEPQCDSIFTGCSNHYPSQKAGYCGE